MKIAIKEAANELSKFVQGYKSIRIELTQHADGSEEFAWSIYFTNPNTEKTVWTDEYDTFEEALGEVKKVIGEISKYASKFIEN